jgi:hypothetical protein
MSALVRGRSPSHVSLVGDALRAADDFLLPSVLVQATGLRPVDVRTSLIHLFRYSAASFVEEGGQTFWYATPETDKRMKVVRERTPEGDGHRGGKVEKQRRLTVDRVAVGKGRKPAGGPA